MMNLDQLRVSDPLNFEEGIAHNKPEKLPKWFCQWNGVLLAITHFPGDMRHDKLMKAMYGYVVGSWGHAEDRMSIDVYVGDKLDGEFCFKLTQLKEDGQFDEYKYVIGCDSLADAINLYYQHMPKHFLDLDSTSLAPVYELMRYSNIMPS